MAIGVGVVALVLVAIIALAGVTSISTGPDQVGLHYKGGAFTSKKFSECVDTSSRQFDGPGDSHFVYPASQRNFVFGGPEADGDTITFVTKDGIEMRVNGVTNFLLNTDCNTLRKFHELIGNRYAAYMNGDETSEGWLRMLNVYIYRPLDTAIDRASQNYTYLELYNDPSKKAQWEQDVVRSLPTLVDRQTDGDEDFFENFAVTLQKPNPPESIKEALLAQQAAVARAKAAEAEAAAREAAAKAQKAVAAAEAAKVQERIKVLTVDGYLKELAIEKGINPFQPSGVGVLTGGSRP